MALVSAHGRRKTGDRQMFTYQVNCTSVWMFLTICSMHWLNDEHIELLAVQVLVQ